MGLVEELLFQQDPALLTPALPPAQAGCQLPLAPVGVGQLCQQLLCTVQLPSLDAPAGQGKSGQLPDLTVGAADTPLIKSGDLRLLCPPFRAVVLGLQLQHAHQHPRGVEGQQVAVGKLPQLVPGQGEGRRHPLRPCCLVYLVEEQADLPLRDVLLKGEKGVQIHAQHSGQGGQQRNIREMDGPFP